MLREHQDRGVNMASRYKFQWVIGIIVFVLGYFFVAMSVEKRVLLGLSTQMKPLIERSLTSYLFGVKGRSSRDDQAIEGLIRQVNMILNDLDHRSSWSPVHVGRISLVSIGELQATERPEANESWSHVRSFSFNIQRDGKPRKIFVEVPFSPNWEWLIYWSIFIAIVMYGLARIFPVPLRGFQETVYIALKSCGILAEDALIVSRTAKTETRFSVLQWDVFNQIIKSDNQETDHLIKSLEVVQQAEDQALSGKNRLWLNYGISNGLDLKLALKLAASDDSVVYDREHKGLLLRGVPVAMQKGPLLYYLWYLTYREKGDGWVSNPRASNKNDSYGCELEELADQLFGGKIDERTLDGLTNGVSARTLNDMRSKIKKAILAELPEELVEGVYLVDDSRPSTANPGGKDFRVSLETRDAMIIVQ